MCVIKSKVNVDDLQMGYLVNSRFVEGDRTGRAAVAHFWVAPEAVPMHLKQKNRTEFEMTAAEALAKRRSVRSAAKALGVHRDSVTGALERYKCTRRYCPCS